MAHVIEESKSGRASCRTCKEAIPKGVLRFGEEVKTQFSDTPALQWHHLMCAAKKRPQQLAEALAAFSGEVPEKAELEAAIAAAKTVPKPGAYPYADHAPSGRAKCLACGEAIEKGSVRIAVEREVDTGAFTAKSAGYFHPVCAAENIEGDDLYARVAAHTTALSPEELEALKADLA